MRKTGIILLCLMIIISLSGCQQSNNNAQVVATTQPVYDFTVAICDGTDISIAKLVTENVSCLHDYTLQVSQMRAIENAEVIILSGAGMEDFLDDALLNNKKSINCSQGIELICTDEDHSHEGHKHETDAHIWLSPANAAIMAKNIANALSNIYPDQQEVFQQNLAILEDSLQEISDYAKSQLDTLSCRNIITFHDGFSYMAQAFDLNIIHAIEEDSGSEASAAELINITKLVKENHLPAIFTECNGSTSAAQIISNETDAKIYALDMGLSERNYFDAMMYNIAILKEALE